MLGDPKGSWGLGGVLHIGHRFADDRCLGKGHPCRGAIPLARCVIGRVGRRRGHLLSFWEIHLPDVPQGDPDKGPFFIARVSRHEVPTTPGLLRYVL